MSDHAIMVFLVFKIFLNSSSVYSCHLLISSASVRFIPFLSFIEPILAWSVPLEFLLFLRSLVFPILLFPSTSWHCSLKKAFLSLLAILWNSAFSLVSFAFYFAFCFSSQLSVRPLQITILPSCISFSLGWLWLLPPVQCYKPLSIALQVLMSIRFNPLTLSLPLYNHKGSDLGRTWMA